MEVSGRVSTLECLCHVLTGIPSDIDCLFQAYPSSVYFRHSLIYIAGFGRFRFY